MMLILMRLLSLLLMRLLQVVGLVVDGDSGFRLYVCFRFLVELLFSSMT